MNRRILLQVTAPALVIGLLLLAACAGGAWFSFRLQKNLATIRTESVTNLQAAQELEINVLQLRFHCYRYLLNPTPENHETILADQNKFNTWLDSAKNSATTSEERMYVQNIEAGYRKYQHELEQLRTEVLRSGKPVDFGALDRGHPVRHIVDVCHDLSRVSSNRMNETFAESNQVNRQARMAMFFLGIGGPAGGILCGFGIARGLSRSIYKLSVHVQDISQRLDQDLASVSVAAAGDLTHLDRQLQEAVYRVQEVTARVERHQTEMLRAEQLSAVGQLAASVAHEVRNPLTSVKLLVEAALRSSNRKPLTTDDLNVIHGAVCRLEQTVQGFLDFARLPTPCRKIADLRTVIDQAIELVRARARQQGVQLALHYKDRPALANVDAGQLSTVLVNLLLNSLDAMPGGGTMTVDCEIRPDRRLQLSVSDTGTGISQKMMERLFTPFASSKMTGTGLGLSISRRIIEEHGGRITADNLQAGARFTILLPGTSSDSFRSN